MGRSAGIEREAVYFRDRGDWRRWLAENAGKSDGIWLVYDKGAERTISRADIVEEALCFGWVDSLPRKRSDSQSMLYLAPRKPKSAWSKVNKELVERLTAEGLMTELGLAAVKLAKSSGTWTALDHVEELREPTDLKAALDAQPAARENWDEFPRSAKRAILEWISGARKTETRSARVAKTVDEAAVNRRANQWRQPKGSGRSAS